MRIDHRRQRLPGSHHLRRPRRSIGSFDPRNKRGHRRSVLLPVRNRSPRAACRSPHSKSRHRATRGLDARHSSKCKLITARRRLWVRSSGATSVSLVRSFCLSPRGRQSQALILKSVKAPRSCISYLKPSFSSCSNWRLYKLRPEIGLRVLFDTLADHSGLMSANLIAFAHFSVSSAMYLPNSAGDDSSCSIHLVGEREHGY
jgi:hypothetical protein